MTFAAALAFAQAPATDAYKLGTFELSGRTFLGLVIGDAIVADLGELRIPVIMLTARSEEADRVIGLDLGADDYVTKPFSIRELLARVRAQLRRTSLEPDSRDEFVFGDVRVYTTNRLVTRRGVRLDISNREFELLRYFLAHRGEVVSREQLLRDVWGYNQVVVTRTVDNFVAKLRLHVEPKPHDPRYLVTVHGSGYQLIV